VTASAADQYADLPRNRIRANAIAGGMRLYFPPWRALHAALWLAAFGLACLAPAVFLGGGLIALAHSGALGIIVVWMVGIFVVPMAVFGVLFLAIAIYQCGNSLTVDATAAGIVTVRRWGGVRIRRRTVARAAIDSIDVEPGPRFANFRGHTDLRVVARHTASRLVVAENLTSEELAQRVQTWIAHG
jgi:hypothetical protein